MRVRLAPIALLAAAGLVAAATPAFAEEPQCLNRTDPVTLSGFVVEGVFPGPPEFTSVPAGDAAFTASFIALASPICMVADPATDTPAQAGIDLVQLACPDRPIVPGQAVDLKGTLFAPHTGYHRARALLACL